MLQFVASIIDSLAWPITTVGLFVLLRKPVERILLTLTKLKYKDLELDFGRELHSIEQQAKQAAVLPVPQPIPKSVGGPKTPAELLEEADRLAPEFPEPAVAVAWSAVEDSLSGAAERLTGTTKYRGVACARTIKLLRERNVIDEKTTSVLARMQNLRNESLHERWNAFGGVSADEAREYIALARGISEMLERIAAGP